MYRVFVADNLAPEGVKALEEYADLDIDFSPGLDADSAIEHARLADAIIVRSATKVRGPFLDAAIKIKVIGRAGIGVDNIDLETATERGIVVLNTPDANATTTAELAIAHMFSLSRKLTDADRSVRDGKWERNSFLGSELSGKTVGVIGFGAIGRLVAERCHALSMHVVGYDPFVTDDTFREHGVGKKEIEELLCCSDYVTLHCPVTEATRGFLGHKRLHEMKQGARLINCARGGLVDEKALLDVIESGHLAGAALDVFENEPPRNSPLFTQKNIQFTPHLGASTYEAQTAVGVEIAHQTAAFLIQGDVTNAVNVPSIAPEKLRALEPYMELSKKLGQLLCRMVNAPLHQVEVGIFGEAANLDPHPIASAAMVGLLCDHHSIPVNQVNSIHLARRQGIHLVETSSADSRDYVSLIRLTGNSDEGVLVLEGAIFDERHPRLVRINDYVIEATLEGHVLFTRHIDRPGVVGAIGAVLGREGINISSMHVGIADGGSRAVALIGISERLNEATLNAMKKIEAVEKVLQIDFQS